MKLQYYFCWRAICRNLRSTTQFEKMGSTTLPLFYPGDVHLYDRKVNNPHGETLDKASFPA